MVISRIFNWPLNFFALTTVEHVSLQEDHSLLQSDHFLLPWLPGWRISFPNVFVKIEKCCTVTSWVKIRVVRSRCSTFKNCRKHIGDAIKAGRPYHSLLCSPGAVQNDGTCLSYASSALQGTCWIRESYSIPLEHSWSTTQTPKWREFLHKSLVSRILGVCFFRVYICSTFLDTIFTLVKCCSGTPTPDPQ